MSASFRIEGLREMLLELRQLPEKAAAAGGALVEEHTNAAADSIIEQYPEVSGNLKAGVKRSVRRSKDGATGRVVSSAPHAFIFETGTASRQTSLGYNRGPMPGRKIYIPTMQKERAALEHDLAQLLRSYGLEVVEGVHGVGPL